MKVTVCEMDDDPQKFEADWGKLGRHVRKNESELVLLPEMPFHSWVCWRPKYDARIWNESVDDHERWVGRIQELGAPLVMGSRPVNAGGRRLNQGFLWSEGGKVKDVHVKGYLPNDTGYWEANWYQRGDREFDSFSARKAKAGMMICSDIWAVQHARTYAKQGAEIVAVPHNAPRASIPRWLAAGTVVSVVSGSFCLASNRSGEGGGVDFGGTGGWVVSPGGKLLGQTSRSRPFVTVDIDLAEADSAKTTYPRDALLPD
jgi:N-carbamoylputrescine amidase